jgi:hypothetical protein
MRWHSDSDYMPLHTAMSLQPGPGFRCVPQSKYIGTYEDDISLSPLATAHFNRWQNPLLFTNDPRVEAGVEERITSDLIHYWPMLAVRLAYLPGLWRELQGRKPRLTIPPRREYCSLFKLIAENTQTSVGYASIISVLKSLHI